MTRTERRLLVQSVALGAGLTVLVAIFAVLGALAPLESWLYDQRARHCQHYSPQPTDKLIHLDIDDRSLDGNSWPWPRSMMGDIVDEVHRAGAKGMAFDIFFSESSRAPDEDERFAAALQRFNAALVPVAFGPKPTITPIKRKAIALLEADLELSEEQVQDQLRADFPNEALEGNDFFESRRQAMFNRIARTIDKSDLDPAALRHELLPRTDRMVRGAPILTLLEEQHAKALSMKVLDTYAIAKPDGVPRLLSVTGEFPPIPLLARTTAGTGFVDYLSDPDGAVRSVPLWVEYDNRLYPQIALSLACRQLDVDVRQLKLTENSVTIPLPGGDAIRIPTRRHRSSRYGEIGMVMDVPYTGPVNRWEYIYDKPDYREPRQHVPASKVLEITRMAQNIRQNNAQADDALRSLLSVLDAARFKAFSERTPDPDDFPARRELIALTINDAAPFIEQLKAVPAAEWTEDDRKLHSGFQALQLVLEQNTRLQADLATQRQWLRDQMEGRAVLMGWIATGKVDFNPTSLHAKCPGVVIHGLLFNAIMTRDFIVQAPLWINLLITLLIGALTTMLAAMMSPARALGGALTLAAIYTAINGQLFYDYANLVVWLGPPLVIVIAIWSGCTLLRFVVERRERARIIRRFQTYVDPALVRYVLENPMQARLDGQMRELTVVFTDLAGFTTLSERLREKSVPLLNEYMGLMVPAIRQRQGYLNKFLGDGIMFFFGAPWDNAAHARDAVRTVMDMHEIVLEFNERLKARELPQVAMRAGISTGQMVVGDAGSIGQAGPHSASDYTVLGDPVNLGARLEGANKVTGTRTLVTARTVELIEPNVFLFRPVAKIQVKGKEEAVMVFEPMALWEDATDRQKNIADVTAMMVERFMAGRFESCLEAVRELEAIAGPNPLGSLYEQTCLTYMRELPAEFDGRIELTEK
jgi:class 3 adenylate cyclase/CHASE2 domain-containing sensor protein